MLQCASLDHPALVRENDCLDPVAKAASAAVAMVRYRRLPRWLGYVTGVVALALLANGGRLGTEEVPAMMLFLLWTLVVAVILLVRRRSAIEVAAPEVATPVAVG